MASGSEHKPFHDKLQILHLRLLALAFLTPALPRTAHAMNTGIISVSYVATLLVFIVLIVDLPLKRIKFLMAGLIFLCGVKLHYLAPALGPFSFFPAILTIIYLCHSSFPRRLTVDAFRLVSFFVFAGASIHKMNSGFLNGNEWLAPNSIFVQAFEYSERLQMRDTLTRFHYAAVIGAELGVGILALVHWPLAAASVLLFLTGLNAISDTITPIVVDFAVLMAIVDRKTVPRIMRIPLNKSVAGILGILFLVKMGEISKWAGWPVDALLSAALTIYFLRQVPLEAFNPLRMNLVTHSPAMRILASVFILLTGLPLFYPMPKQLGFAMYSGHPTYADWPVYEIRGRATCRYLLRKFSNSFANSTLYWKENSEGFPEISDLVENNDCVWSAIPSPMTKWALREAMIAYPKDRIRRGTLGKSVNNELRSPAAAGGENN